MFEKFDKWHKTSTGYLVMAFVELNIVYSLASWAINNGNLFLYMLAIIFFIGTVRNVILGIKGTLHAKQTAKTKKAR